jgi:hypothetical protein
MIRIALPGLFLLAALGACASSYEARLQSTFMHAGLSRPVSNCMAAHLVDRLNDDQLRALVRLTGFRDQSLRRMSVGEFLDRSRALLDPAIYTEVTRVGLGCAIAG